MINIPKIAMIIGLIIAFSQATFSQTATDYENTKTAIVKLYNAAKYTKIYNLLSTQFKREISEDELVFFLETNICESLGKIKSCKFLRTENSSYVYSTAFKKGELHLFLDLNKNSEINGLRFLPKAKPVQLKGSKTKSLLSNNVMQTPDDKKVDSLVRDFWNPKKHVGISIGLVKAGQVLTYGYGEIKVNSGIIPNKETVMEIGSITKTFVGLLVASAEQNGKLHIQDDIRKYLPGNYPNLTFNSKPITIQHLLTHTSGLPRVPDDLINQPDFDPLNPYKNYNQKMMLDYLQKTKLEKQPGTTWAYSNYAVALLKIILEQACEQSFDSLLYENLLNPLNMQHTYVHVPQDTAIQQANVYDNKHQVQTWNLGDMVAAGGISSTVSDMLVYLNAQYQQKNVAIKKSHEVLFNETAKQGTAYLWLVTVLKNGNHLIWHNGATGGSGSFCGFIPETGDMIVVLSNSNETMDLLAMQILDTLKNP